LTIEKAEELFNKIENNISKKIVGKTDEIKLLTIALLSNGHVILEGVPGIAKTLLAKSFADSLELEFKRIQLTPDMLPADITGTFVYNVKEQDFFFRKGPVFGNVILADEINRGIPKTQSALLEAMQEYQVTVEGKTHELQKPFFVIATQNPIEMQGTYPLPEAQLDRFMFRITMDLPSKKDEIDIINKFSTGDIFININSINLDLKKTNNEILHNVKLSNEIKEYIVELLAATRNDSEKILLGASPRATVHLFQASKTLAAINGRDYVIPDDVKSLLFPLLNHRLLLNPDYLIKNTDPSRPYNYDVVKKLISEISTAASPPR
jgi:MoxR-like ATPase|tara:strand:+ start:2558 stop:3526 length:969 start_codon:yes stop_codon:yes gene_type:complete